MTLPRAALLTLLAATLAQAAPVYEPTWPSLARHEDPNWFRDAKFGIYAHWGPVTVGAETVGVGGVQWYGRNMYRPQDKLFAAHREHYGDPNTFGYKDLTRLFHPDRFDAEAWADLYAASGARYAGPVAIHHDNYAMWDSAVTRWDSMDGTPHRDFTGELARAIKARGLHFIAAFHHSFSWEYFRPAYAHDAADGRNADLYGEVHGEKDPPSERYLRTWLAKVNEVTRKYEPELIYFDFGLGKIIPEPWQQRMFADYYNWAEARGLDVAVTHKHWEIHEHTGVIDFERGRLDHQTSYPWQTDTSVGPWFHVRDAQYKTVDQLVDILVDIVSKNGCLLLNVDPCMDGSIPEASRTLLLGMGQWLRVNGEAIYETRPWFRYGEGPTRLAKSGGFNERADRNYTGRDIRYTRSRDGRRVYAIALARPEGQTVLRAVRVRGDTAAGRVTRLDGGRPVRWHVNDRGQLVLETGTLSAGQGPADAAYAFRLEGFDLALHEDARFDQPEAVTLNPGQATLEGARLQTQTNEGRANIGYWDDAGERIHWLVHLTQAGTYAVRAECSAASGDSALRLRADDWVGPAAAVPRTDGWFKPVFVDLGHVRVAQPGVVHLVLEAADPSAWRAVNVYRLQLAPLGEATP